MYACRSMSCPLSSKRSCETHLVGSAPLKYALTDSVKATAMGKASWDARVTGLGPRDVPENEKGVKGLRCVDAAAGQTLIRAASKAHIRIRKV